MRRVIDMLVDLEKRTDDKVADQVSGLKRMLDQTVSGQAAGLSGEASSQHARVLEMIQGLENRVDARFLEVA